MLNILGTDSDKLDLKGLAGIESDLAVYTLLEIVVGVLFNSVPLNDVRVDLVDHLKKHLAISYILIQVVDVNILNFK